MPRSTGWTSRRRNSKPSPACAWVARRRRRRNPGKNDVASVRRSDYFFRMTEPNQPLVDKPTGMQDKRAIMFRAFELTAGQIEHDATELTLRAVMHPELDTVKREHMIHTAFMLRETS